MIVVFSHEHIPQVNINLIGLCFQNTLKNIPESFLLLT